MSFKLLNFLLADANDDHALVVQRLLVRSRVANRVDHVADGAAAMEHLRSERMSRLQRPDVVLADMRLPKLSGPELVSGIKTSPDLQNTKVVLMTSMPIEAESLRALACPPDAILTKPLSRLQLARMVRDLGLFWGVFQPPDQPFSEI